MAGGHWTVFLALVPGPVGLPDLAGSLVVVIGLVGQLGLDAAAFYAGVVRQPRRLVL